MLKNSESKKNMWMIISILISLLGVAIVYEIWNKDINVPIIYNGDGVGAVFTITNFIHGSEFWRFENIAAPLGETVLSQDYFLNILIIKLLAIFTDNTGVIVNLYWLLTYVLTAVTMYALLCKIKICPEIAMVGAVIYNFLPYHYFRLQHFWLMGCYLIPLSVWLVVEMLDEGFFYGKEKFKFFSFFIKKRNVINIIFCVLIGFGGIYYAVFTILIMGIVAIYRAIECKRFPYIIMMAIYAVIIAIPIVFFYLLPSIKFNYSAFSASAATRNISQLDTFGLKLSLLFFPIPGHRLDVFHNFTTSFFETMKGNTEAYIVQLGLIMSLGLIISIASLFCTKIWGECQKELAKYGQINILILLISVVGGLDIFIGLFVSSTIRCYNRLVVYIAAFSIICICLLLNQMFESNKINLYLKYVIVAFIVAFGIWDQTSASFADYEQYNLRTYEFDNAYIDNQYEFYNNKQFIDDILEKVDEEKMVYLMPFNGKWDAERIPFNKKKACIASYETNWSFSVENIEYQKWMEELEKYEPQVFLDCLSVLGFSGIIIDKNSYGTDEEFESRRIEIENCIDGVPIIDESGLLYFYDISDYKEKVLDKYNEDELMRLKNGAITSMYTKINSLMKSNIQITDVNVEDRKNGEFEIPQGKTQFGPYIDLEKGIYEVMVSGINLEDASVWITTNGGQITIPTEIIQQSTDCIIYSFELIEDGEDVEFLMCNNGNDMNISDYYYARYASKKHLEKYVGCISDARYFQREMLLGYVYNNIPLSEFWIKDMQCKNSENKIFIEKGVLQYGPYITLESGYYRVIIQGEGLKDSDVRVTHSGGKKSVELEEIGRADNYLIYAFELNSTVGAVEFLMINNEKDMEIVEYGYEKSDEGLFQKSDSILEQNK